VSRAEELERLIDGAEQLLINLADAHNPAIQTSRDRVDQAIADARKSVSRQQDSAAGQLRFAGETLQTFVEEHPWLAVASGIALAGAIGFILGASLGDKESPEV